MSKHDYRPAVVMLVDNKRRDLPVAAWIKLQLEKQGLVCHLQPLEAYRACLARFRPRLILFNHLFASHLADYSCRLHRIGVQTAVLPNEGIIYDEETRRYNAGKFHRNAHIDHYFCWNEPAAASLREVRQEAHLNIHVVGVPRFDFYFDPLARLFPDPWGPSHERPRVLFCTNFILGRYEKLPPEAADQFFAAWKDRIPLYRDYQGAVRAQINSRARSLLFLEKLLGSGRYDVCLRTHPSEDFEFYERWIKTLNEDLRCRLRVDNHSNITPLILNCDLQISCETCTTALESWLAGKPTIELILDRHPLLYRENHAKCNVPCEAPDDLPELVEEVLLHRKGQELQQIRQHHLDIWCDKPDGHAAQKVASILAKSVLSADEPDWSQLNLTDFRRAWKLRLNEMIGEAYHYDPFLRLKAKLMPKQYKLKQFSYAKSIRPYDVMAAVQHYKKLLND